MAQGDISATIDKLIGELDKINSSNAAVKVSQYEKEAIIKDVIQKYVSKSDERKEAYRYDLKQDTAFSYLKKIHKHSEELFEEREERRKEQKLLVKQINNYKKIEEQAQKDSKDELAKYIRERRTQLEIEKAVNEAMDDVSDTAESATKSGNPYLAAIIVVGGLIVTTVKALFNGIKIVFKAVLSKLKDVLGVDLGVGAVFETFLRMQKTTGEFSANAGLIARESNEFLWNMPKIMNEVLDVGGTIEEVGEVMEKLSDVTGKNRMFTGKQFKSIIELGLGTGLGVEGGAELVGNFDNLGYSLDKTLELTDYAREKSMRVSQNQTSVLKKVNELVVSLTGYGISRGLKGMTDLVIKAQKLRVDVVKSVDSFKDAFTDPEVAVEAAATAKLLGGKFAFYFGDPFTLMAKSTMEPEELTADLLEALKDKAFKGKNGFEISPADREIIRNFAEAVRQDPDELMNGAIEQAKYADKIKALNERGLPIMMYNEEQQDLIANLMTLNEDGSYSMRLSNGTIKRLEEIPSMSLIIKTLEQDRKNEQSALLRKTLAERIGIAIDRFNIGFSQVFVELDKLFKRNSSIENLDGLVFDVTSGMIDWFNTNLSNTGYWGIFIRKGLKAANEFIDKILGIWLNPNTIFTQKFGETLRFIFEGINDNIVPYIQYYGGRLIELLGSALPAFGEKFQKIGLEIQQKSLEHAGKKSMLYENKKADLNQRIADWNTENGGYDLSSPATRAGMAVTGKMVGKQIAKRIPGIGLAIGIFDAIGQAIEGDYDQAVLSLASGALSTIPVYGTAASIGIDLVNAQIDQSRGDNHIEVKDALINSDGTYTKGGVGSGAAQLQSLINVNKPKSVNIVLTGKVSHINKNKKTKFDGVKIDKAVKSSSSMLLKQLTANLSQTSV